MIRKASPPGWRQCTMSDLFKVKHGFAFDGKYFSSEGEYILLSPGNFHDAGGFKLKDKEKYFTGEIPEDYVLSKGDLLVAMTEQAEGLLGSSALIPSGNRFLHNQRLGLITDWDAAEIDLRFLYYLFNTSEVRAQIRASATGTKVRHTSPSRIGEVRVAIPGLGTQRKIATLLSAYDVLIENNARRITILEEMAQSLYREWFVEFRFPGHEKARFIDSPLGKIPAGWEVAPVNRMIGLGKDGLKPESFPEEIFAHYSLPEFDKSQLPSHENGVSIQSNKFYVKDECVLLSKLNPRIPRVWLTTNVRHVRSVASTEFLVAVPQNGVSRQFVYCMFRDEAFHSRFASLASGTSTSHQRVKPPDFMAMSAVWPPLDAVESFTNRVTPLLRLVQNHRLRNRNLRTTRDLLLPKLMSGQVDVEDLDIDIGESLAEADA